MIAPLLDPRLLALAQELPPAPCTAIEDAVTQAAGVVLALQRDDLLHPIISGNKWYKLKYFLAAARANSCHTLVSMGGAYSNHLHALAYCGHKLGWATRAFVRGQRIVAVHTEGLQGRRGNPNFSPTAAQLSASMDFML